MIILVFIQYDGEMHFSSLLINILIFYIVLLSNKPLKYEAGHGLVIK